MACWRIGIAGGGVAGPAPLGGGAAGAAPAELPLAAPTALWQAGDRLARFVRKH
ncbi:MAG TPA: hypothetical protein VL614_20700 [Acetobacteraceae bacterium]|nr:hypothetical protein [Acetobacteraceae bacterium]